MISFSKITLILNCLILIIVFPLVSAIFRQAARIVFGEELIQTYPFLGGLTSYMIILFLLVFYLYATLEPLRNYGFLYSKKLLMTSTAIGVIAAVVLYMVDKEAGAYQALGVPASPSVIAVIGFLVFWAIIGPLVEEVLFRGIIQTTFSKHFSGDVIPIVATVTLEVIMHMGVLGGGVSSYAMLGYVAVFSTAASIVYARTKSLLGPFLIHALGNGGELILYWLL